MVVLKLLAWALFIVTISLLLENADSHGALVKPPQRGLTNGFKYWGIPVYDKWARTDWYAHFPAGDKSAVSGAGWFSQIKAAGKKGWTPYNPRRKGFIFRTGVCGDLKWKPEHLRGGVYYNKGKITHTYKQNGTISFDVALTQHHNGYFQFRVCDVKWCGGEISENCLRGPHCYLLKRVPQESCESRKDWKCAPIDKHDNSRWYLPCPSGKIDLFGGGKMLYQLPKDLHCDHCVVQWYWVAGNQCNPPGLERYFKNNKMDWKQCKGQGESRNGWRRWLVDCHGDHFPEEYYQCSDIRIKKNPKIQPDSQNTAPKAATYSGSNNSGKKPIQKISFLGDGVPYKDIWKGQTVTIDATSFKKVTFRAVTNYDVKNVVFYINGKRYWTVDKPPYYLRGAKKNWDTPIYNNQFKLEAWADNFMFTVKVKLKHNKKK